ncbi:WXG100 family type VII secretion target [Mycobacteroides abscessus]|uniref:WXG100 family type VII secretion target n=1 Tax=Mycobacteroides abscessus TaxID=36809 RepID=UPI0034CD4BC5
MSAEEIKVNLGRLDQVIGELAGFGKEIEQQIATLESRVTALHARWDGQAAAKHVEAHAEWAKGAQLLSDGIKGLHGAFTEHANGHLAHVIGPMLVERLDPHCCGCHPRPGRTAVRPCVDLRRQ